MQDPTKDNPPATKHCAEYLLKRGITAKEAGKLKYQFVTQAHLDNLGFPVFLSTDTSILMPVYDIHGEATGSYGARVFYPKITSAFLDGAEVGADKPKYMSPKGQKMHVYFPPSVNWEKLKYGQSVYICESYIKAAVVCKLGFHAIGFSGVWGWRNAQGLDSIPWREGKYVPIVCFDSNVTIDRPLLYASPKRLLTYLDVKHGVQGGILPLPKDGEDDWGIDDYLMENGAPATKTHLKSTVESVPSDVATTVQVFNDEYVYVMELDQVMRVSDMKPLGQEKFKMQTANRWVTVPSGTEDGDARDKPLSKVWLEHVDRLDVKRAIYDPGGELFNGTESINTWLGLGVEPKEGNVSWWTEWLATVFPDDTERVWLEQRTAWPLQNLGGKMTTCVFLYGPSGVGKGWFGSIMLKIYGVKNSARISLSDLLNGFNSDWAACQDLVVEEVEGVKEGRIATVLKDIVTSEVIPYKRKFCDTVLIDNHINLTMHGNDLGALGHIDHFDRRLAILGMDREGCKTIANVVDYWKPMFEHITNGGAEALLHHLMNVDLSGFDPQGAAPFTPAKRDAIELGMGQYEYFVNELMADWKAVLPDNFDGPYLTTKEAYFFMLSGQVPWYELGESSHQGRINTFGKVLLNAGIPKANDGKRIKNPYDKKSGFFWIINEAGCTSLSTNAELIRQPWRVDLYGGDNDKF